MSGGIDIEGDLLDRLLIIQSLLEHDRRLKSIQQKVNFMIKELSILEEAFEEQREDRVSLNIEPESRVSSEENAVYLQRLLKMLESLNEARENKDKL